MTEATPGPERADGSFEAILAQMRAIAPEGSESGIGSAEDGGAIESRLAEVLTTEGKAQLEGLVKQLLSTEFVSRVMASFEDKPEQADVLENAEQLQQEFVEALEVGTLANIVSTNPFARIATTESVQLLKPVIEKMFEELRSIEVTRPIGRHADLRDVPIASLSEYIRFAPEIGIAFIAGNSTKNMILDLLGQWQATSGLSYEGRKWLAILAGIVVSAMAYNLRHSLYQNAQQEGDKYALLPLKRTTAVASAYRRVLKKKPLRTGMNTIAALLAAGAGGQILLQLAGTSEKSVQFGNNTLEVVRPLREQINDATGLMEVFFAAIDERCRLIVAAEVNPALAAKGTGKGKAPSYGRQAAAKDYLCFGRTQGRDGDIPDVLKKFRTEIGMMDGQSIAQFYKQLWDKDENARVTQLRNILTKLGEFTSLVEREASVSLGEHASNAMLKHVPDRTVIPKAKAELAQAIRAYVDLINGYGKTVDTISRKIATEGLAAARAAGQDIEIQAPKVAIDTSRFMALPDSPTGQSGFFLTKETAQGALAALEKVPVANFVTPLFDKESPLLAAQLSATFALIYLTAEGALTFFNVHRERMRRRRIERVKEPKRRDYYEVLDKMARKIADTVTQGILPLRALYTNQVPEQYQTHEQLVSAIKFAIVNRGKESDRPDDTDFEYWKSNIGKKLTAGIKHLYDWGPEDREELDTAIAQLQELSDDISAATPKETAKILSELGVPGAEILEALFDPEISSKPEDFARLVQNTEIKAMQHNARHLVRKMQARQYVLDQLSSELATKAAVSHDGLLHSERVREFLSSGVIVNLEGDGAPVAASVDEVLYFRVWSELAAEQEQDKADLYKVAVVGRTAWDRLFKVDHSLGTVQIPPEFTEEFISTATERVFSEEAMLAESYKQMLGRMLDHSKTDVTELTDTLNLLNQDAIPVVKRSLEDEDRLDHKYNFSFACTFSTKHGGPVIRVDAFNADTDSYTTSVEAPDIIIDADQTKEQLNQKIIDWFGVNGSGRLEIIARSRHHELRQLVRERTSLALQDTALEDGKLPFNSESVQSEDAILSAQRLMLYNALLSRQALRINSVDKNPLQNDEMPIYELDRKLWDEQLPPEDIVSLGAISIDGIFQLSAAIEYIREKVKDKKIYADPSRGFLIVVDVEPKAVTSGRFSGFSALGRRAKERVRRYPLRELNDLEAFVKKLSSQD